MVKMDINNIAKSLKELGHPTRLMIYKKIVRAGRCGIAVGDLQKALDIPGSTLSHHISSLVSAGLMVQRRESRTLFCVAEYKRLEEVICYLKEECCNEETTLNSEDNKPCSLC